MFFYVITPDQHTLIHRRTRTLIKSVFNTKFESKSTQTYRFQNRSGELNYIFLKVCFVLNGLNKSFLRAELIELQTN